eukprot:CAMPEP_0114558996 /NCGR_PEP_ID=MMETSP0114-20121206/10689_1 /TAXON_ID=31324 /ORGANISM="Goniomonas sp, Strain m" /LENGTH=147 /DNA_ID=CAMNT_0001744443 /DNA_START=658 /DNA_END=1101 /DNA_ORIENTATION=+
MRTPEAAGKCSSSAPESAKAMLSNVRVPESEPGKPPPKSRSLILKPNAVAWSNTVLAETTASLNEVTELQPLPTWKLTPATSRSSSLAAASSSSQSSGRTPNLELNRHRDWESSTARRSTSSASGEIDLILANSTGLSNVICFTPFW